MWTPLERALLTDRVGDMTWDALTSHFEPAELLKLVFVIGSTSAWLAR